MRRHFDPRLYLVTDRTQARGRDLGDIAAAAVAGGVTIVQYREKDLSTRAMIEEVRALLAKLRPVRVPLIVNDRVDVALATDADGVHVGRDDMPPEIARRLIGPDKILGTSVNTPAHLTALDPAIVDYVGAGPAYPTATKSNTSALLGPAGVAALRRVSHFPMVAIAGIGIANAAEIMATGVAGIAVVSAICGAADPRAAAAALRALVEQGRREDRRGR